MKTTSDLAAAVLRELRVSRYDEAPAEDLKQIVVEAYTSMVEEWRTQRVCYWETDAIPEIVFRPVVRLVAAEVAPTFNKPYESGQALNRLYSAVARPFSGVDVTGSPY